MDHYFDWYRIFEAVRLARMQLTGSVRVYRTSIERDCASNRVLIEIWEETKNKLKEKYFSNSYKHCLLDELHHLRQGNMSVQRYTTVFDDRTLCCELQENPHQIISRFHFGLRTDIQ